jgi:hypothetical protein
MSVTATSAGQWVGRGCTDTQAATESSASAPTSRLKHAFIGKTTLRRVPPVRFDVRRFTASGGKGERRRQFDGSFRPAPWVRDLNHSNAAVFFRAFALSRFRDKNALAASVCSFVFLFRQGRFRVRWPFVPIREIHGRSFASIRVFRGLTALFRVSVLPRFP